MISQFHRYMAERSYLLLAGITIITLVTLVLTLLPVSSVLPSKIWSYDKLGHLLMFGGWTFLVGYYRFIKKPQHISLFFIFLSGVIFGIAVELLQYYMPFHRDADLFDVAFDAFGCLLAILPLYKFTQTPFAIE